MIVFIFLDSSSVFCFVFAFVFLKARRQKKDNSLFQPQNCHNHYKRLAPLALLGYTVTTDDTMVFFIIIVNIVLNKTEYLLNKANAHISTHKLLGHHHQHEFVERDPY